MFIIINIFVEKCDLCFESESVKLKIDFIEADKSGNQEINWETIALFYARDKCSFVHIGSSKG